MVNERRDDVPVKSSATMFALLQKLQDNDGAGVTQLANALDVSKSTVHNHLSTLMEYEYVVRGGDEYRIGLRFLDHGSYARTRCRGYRQIKRKVSDVAERTGELCQYLVEEHGKGVFIVRESGDRAVKTGTRVGKQVYLHHMTAGKAALAQMSDERVDEIVERHGLAPKTRQTITTREDLLQELDSIRNRGYAFDEEEHIHGLYAIGVPVVVEEELLGAMSIAGPSHRIAEEANENELVELLQGVADEIEINLTHSSE